MRNKNNKALYESIMRKVSNVVKNALNEHNDKSRQNIINALMFIDVADVVKEMELLGFTNVYESDMKIQDGIGGGFYLYSHSFRTDEGLEFYVYETHFNEDCDDEDINWCFDFDGNEYQVTYVGFYNQLSEGVSVTMPTLIRKINKELDRLYDTHIVNATDDIVMRPLGYPVSYDPMYNILTVVVNDDIRLKRSKGSVEIFDDSIGRYGKYKMLKHENIEFVNDVYMKLRDMK